ncbi:MAG: hypothetical protein M1826_003009 [Phylliscum demangeonii]|nr:MAG: hypothetical protein M1826_003009 [Phylliscum demangeonii]
MQKILRRVAMAKSQVARRNEARARKNRVMWNKVNDSQDQAVRAQIMQDVRQARIARREDYELGPLAPRRDVGDLKDTYAAMDPRRTRGFIIAEEERKEAQPIVTGDRVVLIQGRDKGRIGQVRSVDKQRHECVVAGLNQADVAVPPWLRTGQGAESSPVQTIEIPIPLPDLRLVHTLADETTGARRDVIVQHVTMKDIWFDRHLGINQRHRLITGTTIKIPWPARKPTVHEEHAADTRRADVERVTWVPKLAAPPIPPGVIDELRGKYSKFRDRHDEDYIARKVAEDEEAAAKKRALADAAMTPVQRAQKEAARVRREHYVRMRAKGKHRLNKRALVRIGRVMAQNRGIRFEEETPKMATPA